MKKSLKHLYQVLKLYIISLKPANSSLLKYSNYETKSIQPLSVINSHNGLTVVGGGVMGLSLAFRLAHRLSSFSTPPLKPKDIWVIDQEKFLYSASGQAAGILATHGAQCFLSPFRKHIVESSRGYPEFFNHLNQVLEESQVENIEYQPLFHYHFYDSSSPAQENVRQKRIHRLQREQASDGGPVETLPPHLIPLLSESKYFSSLQFIKGLLFQNHYSLNPQKLLTVLRQAGKKLGVNYVVGKVTHIKNQKNGCVLDYQSNNSSTKPQKLLTKKVVLTTGDGTLPLLSHMEKINGKVGFNHRLKCLQGTILVTEPFLPKNKNLLISLYNKKNLLHKEDCVLYSSYDLIIKNQEDNDKYSLSFALENLWEDLYNLYPALKKQNLKKIGFLTGKRLYNGDKLPLLGHIDQNIFICTAFYKSGLALAPLYSHWVTEMLLHDIDDTNTYTTMTKKELYRETSFLSPFRKKGLSDK